MFLMLRCMTFGAKSNNLYFIVIFLFLILNDSNTHIFTLTNSTIILRLWQKYIWKNYFPMLSWCSEKTRGRAEVTLMDCRHYRKQFLTLFPRFHNPLQLLSWESKYNFYRKRRWLWAMKFWNFHFFETSIAWIFPPIFSAHRRFNIMYLQRGYFSNCSMQRFEYRVESTLSWCR